VDLRTRRLVLRVVVVLLAFLSTASPAYAYLDPGTGSMLVSAVIGVAAAVGLALKMFWYRIVGLFRGKRVDTPPPAAGGAPPAKE
jgi:hypothetical protein